MLVPQDRRRGRPVLVLTALIAAASFALPASASALTSYEVTSIDTGATMSPGDKVCVTAVPAEGCTLRAAIEEANFDNDESTINFKADVFDGTAGDVIPTTNLPVITQPVTINGDHSGTGCTTYNSIVGPCVEISGTTGLVINSAEGVVVRGLAITGASTAINLVSAKDFTLYDTWIGWKLSGVAGANQFGIDIQPGSDGAQIGGIAAAGQVLRNVLVSSSAMALDIEGADNTTIQGNYFGIDPSGVGAAPNVQNLEVTSIDSSTDFIATGTQIGADVSEAAQGTAVCDGGCNVFAPLAGSGFEGVIDLFAEAGQNELPIDGAAIQGNYVGLYATGAAMLTESAVGVLAVKSKDLLIGGGQPGEANHFNGVASYAIYAENAPNLIVGGNLFGLNTPGTGILTPNGLGVYVFTDESIPPGANALVTENHIVPAENQTGIEIQGVGANVIDNTIGLGVGGQQLAAGGIGIYAWGNTGGSLIKGNTIVGATHAGVQVLSNVNEIDGNLIENSADTAILIEAPTSPFPAPLFGAEVGADDEASENEIFGTGGTPIELIGAVGGEVSESLIRRNVGAENGGIFIDLGGNGQGNPSSLTNGGIQAPTIDAATATSAGGTAKPGATIRLFRKATPQLAEIQSFLGQVKADGSGNWSIGFEKLPATNIAATQTALVGTSELAYAVTPADPEEKPSGGGGGGSGTSKDSTPPQTTVAKKPKVKFKFSSSEPGSSFECRLDKQPFKKCRSPKTYRGLKPGKHVFKVRAIDAAGNVDPSPAKKKFKINP